MAIQSQPTRIPEPFAGSGTKNTIPATNATPSASQAASWASGFPPECSQPISAGGCPVPRNDVNGALNQLSQDFAFRQDGGIWEWSALADYDAQRIVRGSDGMLYWSVLPSGPGVAAGAHDPTADDGTYWSAPCVKTMDSSDSSSAAASTAFVESRVGTLVLPTEWYLDSVNGSDSNSGLSAADALKTYSGFAARIQDYPIRSVVELIVHCASGTYSGINVPEGYFGYITYVFDSGVQFDGMYVVRDGSRVTLYGGPVVSTGSIRCACQASIWMRGLSLTFSGVSASSCMASNRNGVININSSGDDPVSIAFSRCTVTSGVFEADANGTIALVSSLNTSFSGTPTGPRYRATHGGVISGTGSTTKIPGTSNGTVDSSSSYS